MEIITLFGAIATWVLTPIVIGTIIIILLEKRKEKR